MQTSIRDSSCRVSPYNIPEPEPIFAGSYWEQKFKIIDPFNLSANLDLNKVPNIAFALSQYGDFTNPLIHFTKKDIISGQQRITIDENDPSIMTVFVMATDTQSFDGSLYDFQIKFLGYSEADDVVAGQGKLRIFNEIRKMV